MNLEYVYILADGLFARRVVKTIKAGKYTPEVEALLIEIETQMMNALNGQAENKNYENSNQKALQILRAYGKAMSIVGLLDINNDEDCVINYVKAILEEVTKAKDNKEIKIQNLRKTLDYYEKVRYNAIAQGSRFNINSHSEDLWETATKF